MQCIDIPELEDFEEYKKKAPEDKIKYVGAIILKILELNKKRGVTIKQIEDATYFHRNTISYHLNTLVARSEAYQYPPDTRNGLYFPNGNFGDPIHQEEITLGNKIFSIYLMSNQLGEFIYIQEKETDAYGVLEVRGGIMIPYDKKEDFVKTLQETIKKFNKSWVEIMPSK